jgi:hypothetical protein
LSNVVAVDAGGQSQAPNGGANQRLVEAQQFLLGAPVLALRGDEQHAFVKRGSRASGGKGSHARPR